MFNLILDGMQETEDQIGCVKGKLVADMFVFSFCCLDAFH